MNKQRFELTERFNNKYYGFRGGGADVITGIDQYGKLILGRDILDVEYERTSKTTWATKYFEVDMDTDGFYRVEDRDRVYIYEIKNKDYKVYALGNRDERDEIFEIIKNTFGVTNVEITEENADIIATESDDVYSLKMVKFSYDTLADIKTLEGRKYNPVNKEWIISKEQKESLLGLGYKIFFK